MSLPWWRPATNDAGRILGVDTADATPLSDGHRATVALRAAGVVLRVARPDEADVGLNYEMTFALFASAHGLPVATPLRERPLATRHGPVSVWPLLEPLAHPLDWAWLGDTLRRLHAVAPHGLARSDPLGRVEVRLHRYVAAGGDIRVTDAVADASIQLRRRVRLPAGGGTALHGDAHPGNVMTGPTGPVLVDFDLAGIGPAEWDLTAVTVLHRRFGLEGDALQACYVAYGHDPRSSRDFEALVGMQELLCVSYALERAAAGDHVEGELRVRARSVADPEDSSRWHALPPSTSEKTQGV